MPTLSEKLRSLGIQVGADGLKPPAPAQPAPPVENLEQVLSGRRLETRLGETFVVEQFHPLGSPYGSFTLEITAPLEAISQWAQDARLRSLPPQAFVFLDTETTGLAGGTGTYAFLIGVGKFTLDGFQLAQFFMRDPVEEIAQLAALEDFIAPCQALVTYNGKAFDIPLLASRFRIHGWQFSFSDYAHVDLLHLSRRLWRDRLPSRTLGNVEAHILGAARTEQDVPGWMIPQMYFDYLRSGDAAPLRSVFYHNAMDVISLAALLNHTASLLADPLQSTIRHAVDLISLARLYEDMGEIALASRLYLHGLQHLDDYDQPLPEAIYLIAVERLANIHKKNEDYSAAIPLWQEAALHRHILSHVELAKVYEHRLRDYDQAIYWTRTALDLLSSPGASPSGGNPYQRQVWLSELEHRLDRLIRKRDSRG